MNIVVFLFVGLLVGWMASVLVDGRGLGPLGDIVVGIVGAFVGGFLFNVFGIVAYGFWGSFVMSIVGAIVFMTILSLLTRTQRRRLQ